MDKNTALQLRELKQKVRLGCSDEERSYPQLVKIDLRFGLDLKACIASDQLQDTIDYRDVVGCIENLCSEREWNTLEKLAYDFCGQLLFCFPKIDWIEITVNKNVTEKADGFSVKTLRCR